MRSENTACPPILGSANELVCVNGVWRQAKQDSSVDYSDGREEESILRETLEGAADLSWNSAEFGPPYPSWAQEYHLSPLRANLLRGLSLPEGIRVLEVGAGCGAVTRFLGDQGFQVDAVEGGTSRAALARARCAGLDNVRIISADFHQLHLPKEGYDLVLFVGVLEYAQRFAPGGLSSRDAVIRMLANATTALAPDGKIIIAIENRLGAKYLAGWPEDHLGTSWSGVAGYPAGAAARSGIRTFDQAEWESIFGQLDLQHRSFFPLPDYKLPEAFVSDRGYLAPGANAIWGRYVSVNRTPASPPSTPARFQQNALYRAGLLPSCADSFGIVASRSDKSLEGVMPHDWIVFGVKSGAADKGLCIEDGSSAAGRFPASSPDDPSITLPQGEPIYQYWLRCAVTGVNEEDLSKVLAGHLAIAARSGLRVPGWCLLVNETGGLVPQPFPWPSGCDSAPAADDRSWEESVLDGFFEFAAADLEFNVRIGPWDAPGGLKQQILQRLSDPPASLADPGKKDSFAAIYWAAGTAFSEEQKSTVQLSGKGKEILTFLLPRSVRSDMLLRFDPLDHDMGGNSVTVKLESMRLYPADDSVGVDLMPVFKNDGASSCNQLQIRPSESGVIFAITGNDPWVVVDPASLGMSPDLSLVKVEAHLDWGSKD